MFDASPRYPRKVRARASAKRLKHLITDHAAALNPQSVSAGIRGGYECRQRTNEDETPTRTDARVLDPVQQTSGRGSWT
jgi:hypothetical protein